MHTRTDTGYRRRTVSTTVTGEIIGVGPTTVNKLIRAGELRTAKVGRRRLVFLDSIDELLERSTSEAAA